MVDVHNHVVGLITRKDLMPFKMQERLESLLDQSQTAPAHDNISKDLPYSDVERKSTDSVQAAYMSTDEQLKYSPDLHNVSGDVMLPLFKKNSSTNKMMLVGLEEKHEKDTIAISADNDPAEDSN